MLLTSLSNEAPGPEQLPRENSAPFAPAETAAADAFSSPGRHRYPVAGLSLDSALINNKQYMI